MRSPLGAVLDVARSARASQPPVPYSSRRGAGLTLPFGQRDDRTAQLAAMGTVGTLFAIVDRTSTATAAVTWHLYRKAKSGKPEDRVEVTSHAALDVWTKPNAYYTRQELVEAGQQHNDLTGETWLIVARDPRVPTLPLELWPVRPDRMAPVPDPEKFLLGYMYTGPAGEQVALTLDQVIFIRRPNPLDPYRGMGPVQAILADLDAERYSAQWNLNFFRNGAEPGGLIEVDNTLDDDQFEELRSRWNEQHRGVANAHRVAILEGGARWVDRKFSQKDMQFAELRGVSKDTIREGFGMPKFAVGDVADVNRATAEASRVWFGEQITQPRADRWKAALNNDYLPLFGATAEGLEFDYDSPVPEDREADNAERTSKATAAKTYIEAGYTGESVKEALELPSALVWQGKPSAPPPAAQPPGPTPATDPGAEPAPPTNRRGGVRARAVRNAEDLDPADLPDVTGLQDAWQTALDNLLHQWDAVTRDQIDQLVTDVQRAVEAGDLAGLADLTVNTGTGAGLLETAMVLLAADAAAHLVAEADAQGVTLTVGTADAAALAAVAQVVADLLGSDMATSAARAALIANGPNATAEQVAAAVREHLESLTDANPALQLGGALTGAQNAGRLETLRGAPEGALYASEVNDRNTCQPCREVNGRWLGNISDLAQVEKSYPAGAFGGYVHCKGGARCRGTVVGVWRPAQTDAAGAS